MGALVELVLMLLFGWIPERPRSAMWLVLGFYVVLFGSAIAFTFAQLL